MDTSWKRIVQEQQKPDKKQDGDVTRDILFFCLYLSILTYIREKLPDSSFSHSIRKVFWHVNSIVDVAGGGGGDRLTEGMEKPYARSAQGIEKCRK